LSESCLRDRQQQGRTQCSHTKAFPVFHLILPVLALGRTSRARLRASNPRPVQFYFFPPAVRSSGLMQFMSHYSTTVVHAAAIASS
jgi:hypothetical protein